MKSTIDPYFEKVIDEKFGRVYDRVDTIESKLDSLLKGQRTMQESIEILSIKAINNSGSIRILKWACGVLALAIAATTGGNLVVPVEHLLKFP